MDCIAKTKAGAMHEVLTGPDASNTVLMTLPGGIQFPVKRTFGPTEAGVMWYELATSEGPGWLSQDEVETRGDACPEPPDDEVVLPSTPGVVNEEGPVAAVSEPVVVSEPPVTTSEPAAAAEPAPTEAGAETVMVAQAAPDTWTIQLAVTNDSQVRVRSEPNTDATILHYGLRKNVETVYLSTSDDGLWYKVRLYDESGTEGWLTAAYADVRTVMERRASPNIATEPGTVLVEVPYHSQEDADADAAWADCGPTSLRMLIAWDAVRQGKPNPDLTVNAITQTVGIGPKQFSSFNQLIAAATHYGLDVLHTNQATIGRVKRELDAGRPTLQLVRYGSYSGRQHTRFTAGHFLVVVGYDAEHMIVNDPYWSGNRRDEGHNWRIPLDEFEHSIGPRGSRLAGNMPYQALFFNPASL